VFNPGFWRDLFRGETDRVLGPAWLAYADVSDFNPATTEAVKLLSAEDDGLLRAFASDCSELDWEHSGIEFGHSPIFGYFTDGKILAATNYEVWGARIAHIGVVTHPSYRGKGYGRAVVSAAADYALGHDLIAQYRTLESNLPSVAVGRSVGFRHYASTIKVVLSNAG
jgi:RimJ/RimL family protein N-acetyltransferase